MKNLVLISLLSIYSLSVIGVGFKGFYCCGKLTSLTVTLGGEKKGKNKEACCKITYKYLKVKDNHIASTGDITVGKIFTGIIQAFGFAFSSVTLTQAPSNINGSHAPPIYNSVPLYLSNCVFRI